jgi:hypothetical protein
MDIERILETPAGSDGEDVTMQDGEKVAGCRAAKIKEQEKIGDVHRKSGENH